jgi:uncharacterized protein (TIGR03083 family)
MLMRPSEAEPILVSHLLRPLDERLMALLREISPAEWELSTIVGGWRVRDVVAHMLDTHLRKLAIVRDGFVPQSPDKNGTIDLVSLINRLNDEGVRYFGRLSTGLLISMMESASREACAFHESLNPFAPATFPVSWAGEDRSLNWFDTARELTERWHHQQQIRLASSRPGIETAEFYGPVLDCFLRGLPYCYRRAAASPGTTVEIEITGECGGRWRLYRDHQEWMLTRDRLGSPATRISVPQSIAWRIFTKGISVEAARKASDIAGDEELGRIFFHHLAIVG